MPKTPKIVNSNLIAPSVDANKSFFLLAGNVWNKSDKMDKVLDKIKLYVLSVSMMIFNLLYLSHLMEI